MKSEFHSEKMEENIVKRITDSELLELPFGSKIKVIWSDSIYCNKRAEYYGIVFGNNIGYEGGSIDDLRTVY